MLGSTELSKDLLIILGSLLMVVTATRTQLIENHGDEGEQEEYETAATVFIHDGIGFGGEYGQSPPRWNWKEKWYYCGFDWQCPPFAQSKGYKGNFGKKPPSGGYHHRPSLPHSYGYGIPPQPPTQYGYF